jgi:hypothetical protein
MMEFWDCDVEIPFDFAQGRLSAPRPRRPRLKPGVYTKTRAIRMTAIRLRESATEHKRLLASVRRNSYNSESLVPRGT